MCDEVNDELAMLIIDPEQTMIDWEEYDRETREQTQCKSLYQARIHSNWGRWELMRCTKRDGHKDLHLANGIVWDTIQERRRVR